MKVTGWDNGLCQDYDKGLGRWFANRLGARQQLRQDFKMTQVLIDKDDAEVALTAIVAAYGASNKSATALRAALANAEPAGWIAVKDRMPPPQVRVLGFEPQYNIVDVDMWFGPDFNWGYSYWMPLPTPPKDTP